MYPREQVVIYLMVQCRDPGSIPGSTISFISYPLILVLGIFVFFVLKSIFNYNAISCHYIIQKTSSFDPVILLLYTIFVCKWKLRKVAKCKQVSNYVTRVQTSRDQRANSGEAPSIGRARERDTLNQEQEVGGRRGASNNQAKIIVLAGGKKAMKKILVKNLSKICKNCTFENQEI